MIWDVAGWCATGNATAVFHGVLLLLAAASEGIGIVLADPATIQFTNMIAGMSAADAARSALRKVPVPGPARLRMTSCGFCRGSSSA
jgi:hypothetical protein